MYYQKIALGIAAFVLLATAMDASRRNWNTEERQAIRHTFAGDKTLDVDNVDGNIQVLGDGGSTIRVEGEEIIRGEDRQAVDRAKREVKLDINEKDGVAQLYVNGPFRNNNRGSDDHGFHVHFDDREYETTFNFIIHVPRDTALRLRTVNSDITAEDTRGKFDIRGVNGRVTMTRAAGSGSLQTVNGRLAASFSEAPKGACNFHTVNGAIEVSFPPNLSADLRLRTMNGQAYTDFEAKPLASSASADSRNQQTSRGRFVYRINHTTNVRVGSGGPELNFETLNGDIRIRKEAH